MFVFFFHLTSLEESLQWANEHSELWLTDRDIELENASKSPQFGITQDWEKLLKIDRSLTLVTKVKSG